MIGPDGMPIPLLSELDTVELPAVPPPGGCRPRWWGLGAWMLAAASTVTFLAVLAGYVAQMVAR